MNKKLITTYSDFHFEHLGYSFIDKKTKQIKTKLQVFLSVNGNTDKLNDIEKYYTKVDSRGWENGEYIYCNSTNCDCRLNCFRFKNRKHNALTYKYIDKFHCGIFDAIPI